MSLKRIVVAVVVTLSAMALGGCSAPSGAVAASVEGQVISQTTVDQAAQGVVEILSKDVQYESSSAMTDPVGFVLPNQIFGLQLAAGLSQQGVTITDEQRAEYMVGYEDNSVFTELWQDSRTKSSFQVQLDIDIINQLISTNEVDYDQLMAAMTALDIQINPRYGDWDMTNLTITSRLNSATAGSLALPTAFPAP